MKFKEFIKVKRRAIAYVAIIGGFAVASLVTFSISQYAKAKYSAANTVLLNANNKLKSIYALEPDALTNENAANHDKAQWYNDISVHFTSEVNSSYTLYQSTCVTAYALSLCTLVSFGFVLKHADYVKNKEDNADPVAA